MRIFVVGVDRRIQYHNGECGPEWTRDIREFQRYLVTTGREHEVDTLAEEFSQDQVSLNRASASCAQEVAGELGIPHLFCDPDRRERTALGISTSDQRAMVWLDRLRALGGQRVLYVCADDHVDSFSRLLSTSGFETVALRRGWGKGWQLKN